MSIIYEALKKTQSRLINRQEEKPKNNAFLWFTIGFIFTGFLGCGFALMLLINSAHPKTSVKLITAALKTSEKTPAAVTTAPAKKTQTPLVLNGIISMEGENVALINNQILKEGDYIDGMRIINITKDKVELYSQGKLLVLTQK